MEELDVCVKASNLSDAVYRAVASWPSLLQRTLGTQLIDSLDSVEANLIEGDGRGPGLDALRFFRIARASCREARYWLRRAAARNVIEPQVVDAWIVETTEIAKMINALIAHRKSILPKVREEPATYDATDPFAPNSLTP